MRHVTSISFPNNESLRAYCDSHSYEDYPFKVFLDRGLKTLELSEITILYGNNGSGKSTILNCIAEKVGATRSRPLFYENKWVPGIGGYEPLKDYLNRSHLEIGTDPETGLELTINNRARLITSDDIFNKINNTIKNNNISVRETNDALEKLDELHQGPVLLKGMDHFDEFTEKLNSRRQSPSQFIKEHSRKRYQIHSNGETAIDYFNEMFEENGLYFLDEPENCLSPVFQIELMKLILEARRFFNCQFVIATHSPLILSLPDALVYDLDSNPIAPKNWYELENVIIYYEFFKKNQGKFEK